MANAVEPNVKPALGPERFVFYDVGWEGYQALLKLTENRRVRVTYDRGKAEVMAPLPIHEIYKALFGRLVEAIGEELDIQLFAQASTTFSREDLDKGLEPDECFYIDSANLVRDRAKLNLDVDPPPDLVIEVDITSSSIDRQGIYAAMGVPEIWRFDGDTLSVLLLSGQGSYEPSSASASFPFLPMAEVARFIRHFDRSNDTRWAKEFRAWLRGEILPKLGREDV